MGGKLHAPAAFTSGKDPVLIVQEAGWAPGPVWTGGENLAPIEIRSQEFPARSQSLYRLSYRGPWTWAIRDLKFKIQKIQILPISTPFHLAPGALVHAIKQPGREGNYTPACRDEDKNRWSYTATAAYDFIAWTGAALLCHLNTGSLFYHTTNVCHFLYLLPPSHLGGRMSGLN